MPKKSQLVFDLEMKLARNYRITIALGILLILGIFLCFGLLGLYAKEYNKNANRGTIPKNTVGVWYDVENGTFSKYVTLVLDNTDPNQEYIIEATQSYISQIPGGQS